MSTEAFSRRRSPMRGSEASFESTRSGGPGTRRRAGAADGDPQGVLDAAAAGLVVAGEEREDREAGGVGGRPARPGAASSSAGSRPRPSRRASSPFCLAQREQLVEPAARAVDEQRVAVRAALDLRVGRDRVADAVGLVGVVEGHLGALGRPADGLTSGSRSGCPRRGPSRSRRGSASSEPDRGDDRRPSRPRPAGRRRAGWSRTTSGTPGTPSPSARRGDGVARTAGERDDRDPGRSCGERDGQRPDGPHAAEGYLGGMRR